MLLDEWQGIPQFISQSCFSFDSVFFSFPCHCFFVAILKASADTNAGQSHRLTHCIKNLHCYNLKSLIFKHSLLFIHTFKTDDTTFEDRFFCSQSLTNTLSLPLIYSISSKHVSDLSAPPPPPKKRKKTDTSGLIFPTTPRQRSNPQHREGLANQIPHSRAQKIVKRPGFARGGVMFKFPFDRRIIS